MSDQHRPESNPNNQFSTLETGLSPSIIQFLESFASKVHPVVLTFSFECGKFWPHKWANASVCILIFKHFNKKGNKKQMLDGGRYRKFLFLPSSTSTLLENLNCLKKAEENKMTQLKSKERVFGGDNRRRDRLGVPKMWKPILIALVILVIVLVASALHGCAPMPASPVPAALADGTSVYTNQLPTTKPQVLFSGFATGTALAAKATATPQNRIMLAVRFDNDGDIRLSYMFGMPSDPVNFSVTDDGSKLVACSGSNGQWECNAGTSTYVNVDVGGTTYKALRGQYYAFPIQASDFWTPTPTP
jgi:hypothetical protein